MAYKRKDQTGIEKMREDRDRLEEIKSLYVSGLTPATIAEQTGIDVIKIRGWVYQKKWLRLRRTVKEATESVKEAATRHQSITVSSDADGISQRVKLALSNEILSQAAVLNSQPPATYTELVTNKEYQGRAQTVHHIAAAAEKIFPEWREETQINTLVQVGEVNLLAPDQEAPKDIVDIVTTDAEVSTTDQQKELESQVAALKKQNEELRRLALQAAEECERLEKEKAKLTPQPVVSCGVKRKGPVDITPAE